MKLKTDLPKLITSTDSDDFDRLYDGLRQIHPDMRCRCIGFAAPCHRYVGLVWLKGQKPSKRKVREMMVKKFGALCEAQ